MSRLLRTTRLSLARPTWILCAVLAVQPCFACSNLLLSKYRDPALLEQHRYTLGEHRLGVNGMEVCYQDFGAGEAVVVLPGVCTSIDFWQLNIPGLAKYHRTIAFDPPGFGKSEKPDAPYDLHWNCSQVLAFLDARGIQRASFLGGSLGGHIGLLLALNNPERVHSLVLMGSTGMWPEPGPLLDLSLRSLWSEALVTDHLRRAWPSIYSRMFIRQTPLTEDLLRYQMAVRADGQRYAPEGRACARALRSIFYNSCRERLPDVRVPVLLIWGQADHIHPIQDAIYLREHLPDARLVVVPDAGHEVMMDRPEVFNELVLSFLQGGTQAVEDCY